VARTVSQDFKDVWARLDGKVDDVKIQYKRRYYNGSAIVYEDNWTDVRAGEIVDVGNVTDALDEPFRNAYTIGAVPLTLDNSSGKWFKGVNSPSIFAPDAVAAVGYIRYWTSFRICYGYQKADGSYEYVSEFTGIAGSPKFDYQGRTVQFMISSRGARLEATTASDVSDAVTGGACTPANANSILTSFVTNATGIFSVDKVYVGGVLQQANSYAVTGVDAPGGGAEIKFNSAPSAGAVTWDGYTWKADIAFDTLAGLLCDLAAITSSDRAISAVVFSGGLTSNMTVDTQGDWAGTTPAIGVTPTNVSTNKFPGSFVQSWRYIDDWDDGDFTANPQWLAGSSIHPTDYTGWSISGGKLQAATPTYQLYTFPNDPAMVRGSWELEEFFCTSGEIRFYPFCRTRSIGFTPVWNEQIGYCLRLVYGSPHYTLELRYINIAGSETVLATVQIDPVAADVYRMCRDGSGNWTVFRNAAQIFSGIVENTIVEDSYGWHVMLRATGSATFGKVKYTPEYDLAAPPATVADAVWEGTYDFGQAPASWGPVTVTSAANGGTIVVKTASKANSGDPYSAYSIVTGDVTTGGVNNAAVARFAKLRIELTIPAGQCVLSPEVQYAQVSALLSQSNLSLASFLRGKSAWDAMQTLARVPNYEIGFKGDGSFYFRPKTPGPAVMTIDAKALVGVLDYDDGEDGVQNVGYVNFNGYSVRYDAAAAGEAAPTSEKIYGRRLPNGGSPGSPPQAEDFSDVFFPGDINLALSMAQSTYEERKDAKRKVTIRVRYVPWLESGDVVTLNFAIDPKTLNPIFGDDLVDWASPDASFGPSFIALNWNAKILSRTVQKLVDKKSEPYCDMVLEEVLS
jgi:hypothetical protein